MKYLIQRIPPQYFGPVINIIGQFMFVCSYILLKYISQIIPVDVIIFYRFLLTPIFLLPLFIFRIIRLDFNEPWLFLIRLVAGASSMFCYFTAIQLGSPGKVTLLHQMAVIWAFLFSILILKEKTNLKTLLSVPAAFIGLIMIIKPQVWDFSQGLSAFSTADMYAALASVFLAVVLISLKRLRKNNTSLSIVFIYSCFGSVFFMAQSGFQVMPPHIILFIGMIFIGIFAFIGQFLTTETFHYTSISTAASLNLSCIPMMYLVGITLFGERVDLISLIGICVVVGALFSVVRNQPI
ncbi:DMT family transporter [Thermoproteota archaeon]